MRESSVPRDEVVVLLRVLHRRDHRAAQLGRRALGQLLEQGHRALLHVDVLAVHVRHVEEGALVDGQPAVVVARDALDRGGERLPIGLEHAGRPAKHVARKLIQHDHVGDPPARIVQPRLAQSAADVRVRLTEPLRDLAIESLVFHEPAARVLHVQRPSSSTSPNQNCRTGTNQDLIALSGGDDTPIRAGSSRRRGRGRATERRRRARDPAFDLFAQHRQAHRPAAQHQSWKADVERRARRRSASARRRRISRSPPCRPAPGRARRCSDRPR